MPTTPPRRVHGGGPGLRRERGGPVRGHPRRGYEAAGAPARLLTINPPVNNRPTRFDVVYY